MAKPYGATDENAMRSRKDRFTCRIIEVQIPKNTYNDLYLLVRSWLIVSDRAKPFKTTVTKAEKPHTDISVITICVLRTQWIIEHCFSFFCYLCMCGPGSSVGIATELRAGRSGIEIERDFSPVQTGSGAHPASCKTGTGSFPGVKCGRDVLLTTHPLLVPRS